MRILIAGYYGFGNVGDDAVLHSMLDDIRARLPHAETTVLSESPEATRLQYGTEAAHWTDVNRVMSEMRDADMLVIGGGGLYNNYQEYPSDQMMDGGWGRWFSQFIFCLPAFARRFYLPCFVYGVGASEIYNDRARRQAGFCLAMADMITVRDEASKRILEALPHMGARRVRVTADPVFRFSSPGDALSAIPDLMELPKPLLTVNLRNWPYNGNREEYEPALAKVLADFARRANGSLVFLPFDNGKVCELEMSHDDAVFERMDRLLPDGVTRRIARGYVHPRDAAATIQASDVVLSMRLHPIVMAIAGETPVVGLAYDKKVRAVMSEAGLESFCLELADIPGQRLPRLLETCLDSRESVRSTLRRTAADMRKRAGETCDLLAERVRERDAETVADRHDMLALTENAAGIFTGLDCHSAMVAMLEGGASPQAALACCERLLSRPGANGNPYFVFLHGYLLQRCRKNPQALEQYREAERLGLRKFYFYRETMTLLKWMHEPAAAREYAEKALSVASDGDDLAPIHALLRSGDSV